MTKFKVGDRVRQLRLSEWEREYCDLDKPLYIVCIERYTVWLSNINETAYNAKRFATTYNAIEAYKHKTVIGGELV